MKHGRHTITFPMNGWADMADRFPHIPVFERGMKLQIKSEDGVVVIANVVSWTLPTRKLVVEVAA